MIHPSDQNSAWYTGSPHVRGGSSGGDYSAPLVENISLEREVIGVLECLSSPSRRVKKEYLLLLHVFLPPP